MFIGKYRGVFSSGENKHEKWLLCCSYSPHKALIENHTNKLRKVLAIYLHKYDHILLTGDFNSEISERLMHDFCNVCNLESLPNTPTCSKNSENPSCIALLQTNSKKNLIKHWS